jgi:hypothetical protein
MERKRKSDKSNNSYDLSTARTNSLKKRKPLTQAFQRLDEAERVDVLLSFMNNNEEGRKVKQEIIEQHICFIMSFYSVKLIFQLIIKTVWSILLKPIIELKMFTPKV